MLAVFAGLGVGLVLSVGLSSVLARWSIRNVDDPVVLVAAVGTLLLSTGIATLIPARRAAAIEPTECRLADRADEANSRLGTTFCHSCAL
jgi:ABC-type antimicrobial peptide transport system permease subunit